MDRTGNPVCNPDLFSVAGGYLVEKVGNEALLDKDLKHSPKDLAAACFVATVKKMNPKVKIGGQLSSLAKPDSLLYVQHVLQLGGKGGEKSWLKKSMT